VKSLYPDFEDDIPLGHAIFLVREDVSGAEIIPELTSFQADGKLFDVAKLDSDLFEREMLSPLEHLREILRARLEEEWPL
jgi:hypothetical protein